MHWSEKLAAGVALFVIGTALGLFVAIMIPPVTTALTNIAVWAIGRLSNSTDQFKAVDVG